VRVCWQQQTGSPKSWRSLDLEHGSSSSAVSGIRPSFRTQRSSSMPTPRSTSGAAGKPPAELGAGSGSAVCHGYAAAAVPPPSADLDHSPPGPVVDVKERSTRGSVSNENNILLDPEVLTDYPTQALLLTVLVRTTQTHTQPFNSPWSGTTRVGRYQNKHSPSHTHPDHRTSFINFLHLLRSIASSVFSLRA